MLAWLWFLIAVPVLGAVLSGMVLHVRFRRSPEKRWRDRVLAQLDEARHRVSAEQRRLEQFSAEREEEARQLRVEAFARALRNVPVEDLDPYPGIGPDTIARLRDGGFPDVAALQNAHIHIHGLGPKRLTDINHAVRDLTNRARERFNHGEDDEAKRLASRLASLAAKHEELTRGAQARIRAAERVADALQPYVKIARQVTFWRYFRPPPEGVVPQKFLQAVLPDLEESMAAAERPAEAAFAQPADTPEALPAEPALAVALSVPAVAASSNASSRLDGRRFSASAPAASPARRLDGPLESPASSPRMSPPAPVDHRAILEIDAGLPLTADLIRRQFRLLSERYTPDKFSAVGAEFVAVAQAKEAAVRSAAAALLAQLGEQLETPAARAAPAELRHNPDLDAMFGA